MTLDAADIRLVQRIAREAALEMTRGKLPVPVRRVGTVVEDAANGQVAQVLMDSDAAQGIADPALPLNTLGRAASAGEKVIVTFAEGSSWITESVLRFADLPIRDTDTSDSATTTTGFVDSLASVEFTQFIDGMPVMGRARGHVDSDDSTAVVEVSVRDASDVVIMEHEFRVGGTTDQGFSFWWDEEPAAGLLTRKLSLRRISGAGNVQFSADTARPIVIRLDLADPLMTLPE